MVNVLHGDPGVHPVGGHDYLSAAWGALVDGEAAVVLGYSRTAQHFCRGMWNAGDVVEVSWLRYQSTAASVVTLTGLVGAELTDGNVKIVPPRDYRVLDSGTLELTMGVNDRVIIIAGGTKNPVIIQTLPFASGPTGTIVVFDGSQTEAAGGECLHFVGPAVYSIGQNFPMQANATVYLDEDVVIDGSFDGHGRDGTKVLGYGNISGEWATTEQVQALATFGEQWEYVAIRNSGPAPGYAYAESTEVDGPCLIASPFFAITGTQFTSNVAVLSPWCSNQDGLEVNSGSPLELGAVDNCVMWTGDDCLKLQESTYSGTVTNVLLASSYSSSILLGYWSEPNNTSELTVLVDVDVFAVQSFFEARGIYSGHVVLAESDGTLTTDEITDVQFSELRVWARPDGVIDARFVSFNNLPFSWGDANVRNQNGSVNNISFESVTVEVAPTTLSLLHGKDATNTTHDISFIDLVIGGVQVTEENKLDYFTISEFAYNIAFEASSIGGEVWLDGVWSSGVWSSGVWGAAGNTAEATVPSLSAAARGRVRNGFDPIPAGDEVVIAQVHGRYYKVVAAVELDGGDLSSMFGDVAVAAIGVFTQTKISFSRVSKSYDPTTATDIERLVAQRDALATPPLPYEVHEVNGSSVLASDVRVLVPAKEFDPNSVTAVYDLQLRR